MRRRINQAPSGPPSGVAPKACGPIAEGGGGGAKGSVSFPLFIQVKTKKNVESVYGPDTYALEICLSSETFQALKGGEDSYREMF